ncbi:hypothetical protein Leryth_001020 [Lithospermum erythrorhizon]|nr:hypothetical protein Leryth_001020 [Lithospermum erythrorhizon]
MNVNIKNFELIKPAKPTWSGILSLSELDQTGIITHVPTFYFYRPPQAWLTPEDPITKTFKTSLSKVLVHFYPLAGRLSRINGWRFELDCNAKGVQFLEAETEERLDRLGDFAPSPLFVNLSPRLNYSETSIQELPIALVQLTKFRCGGICLAILINHAVADGQSAVHFLSEWTRLARGLKLASEPCFDRRILLFGEPSLSSSTNLNEKHNQFSHLPALIDQSKNEAEKRGGHTRVALLNLSKFEISLLKDRANEDFPYCIINQRLYTRYEAVTAHIWRTACKARGHLPTQSTVLGVTVDARKRMNPPLSEKFFGNGVINVIADGCSGELLSRPIGFAASRVREAILSVNTNYVHSCIDFLKHQENLSLFQDLHAMMNNERPRYFNPNVTVTSWTSLPLSGMNFGFGNEVCMAPGHHESDGDCLILPGRDEDGSLIVAVCFQAEYMDAFKKIFYKEII